MHVHIYAFAGMAFCVSKHSRPHFNSNMQIPALSPTHIHIYIHGNTRTYIYCDSKHSKHSESLTGVDKVTASLVL